MGSRAATRANASSWASTRREVAAALADLEAEPAALVDHAIGLHHAQSSLDARGVVGESGSPSDTL